MSQHDMDIANANGQDVRNDLNLALKALASLSSGATAPTTTFPFMFWADTSTSPKALRMRNAADTAWLEVGSMESDNFGLLSLAGGVMAGVFQAKNAATVGTPDVSFSGDTDTGLYSPGANILGLVAGAIEYLRVSSAGTTFAKNFNGGSANDAATGSNQTLTAPTTPLVRLTSGTLSSIDGIPAGQPGQFLVLMNATGTTVTINDETGATAANRIRTGSGSVFSFQNNAAVFMIYDNTSSRWRMIGGAGGGSRVVSSFTGTTITPTVGSTDQTWLYTGGSSQDFAGFGALAGLTNGARFRIIGSDDTNTLKISHNDTTDGWLTNGPIELGKGSFVDCEYNSTLGRVVIL